MATERKELFSEKVSAGSRAYFFDVKQSKEGTRYVVISESRQLDGDYEHHRVMIFEESLDAFCTGFEKATALLGRKSKSKSYSLDEIRQKHPKAYEKWTPNEDIALKEKHSEGMSIPDIASFFQRQPSAIISRLAKLGIERVP